MARPTSQFIKLNHSEAERLATEPRLLSSRQVYYIAFVNDYSSI